MSQLIETIRLQNGVFYNLEYHEARMRRTLKELFDVTESRSLLEAVSKYDFPRVGLYKCRLVYNTIVQNFTFSEYDARPVQSLKLIDDNELSYNYKFSDRTKLNNLFKQRSSCDDVLIIKKGLVTDTTYTNIIFKKGTEWFTPASCLLQGTMRQQLIDLKKLRIIEISEFQIRDFEKFKLINSMLFDTGSEVDVSNIVR